ncbi:MAG: polysaccharide deacetylase family protein [Thermaerobacter sp.]|nr:polysaccharide deacetylase family protein [Thermaerobacter sp.]
MLPALLALLLMALPAGLGRATTALMHVPTHRLAVALTVNDGPDGRITPMILRLLQERGAHATFFVNGDALQDEPQMLLEIRAAGCEIGNHGFYHRRLAGRPVGEVKDDLRRTSDLIASVSPTPVPYLRPPFGAVDNSVLRAAKESGLRVVLWNVGAKDETLHAVPARLHPGDIVSVRDDREGLKQLRQVLDLLQREHLKGDSLGMLLARQ